VTQLRDQTFKSRTLKKESRCKLKHREYIQQNNSRKPANIEKEMPFQVPEAPRTPNKHDQNRASSWHIKTLNTENRKEY
jgi:hypothetical protein